MRILGPKRDRLTGDCRKLLNEELNDLYSSHNSVWVIKSRMRWVGHVTCVEERRGVHKVLVGNPEGKRLFGETQRRRWKDNVKMDLEEVDRGCKDMVELAQDRDKWRALVSTVMNIRVL
jgi:hypothetical protein